MPDEPAKPRIDPELTRQLESVAADDSPVQAVVYLDSGEGLSPAEVDAAAQRLIESASSKAASGPTRVNVMKNLGVVAVEAPASFVRSLIEEPGIASAVANVQPSADAGIEEPRRQSTEWSDSASGTPADEEGED